MWIKWPWAKDRLPPLLIYSSENRTRLTWSIQDHSHRHCYQVARTVNRGTVCRLLWYLRLQGLLNLIQDMSLPDLDSTGTSADQISLQLCLQLVENHALIYTHLLSHILRQVEVLHKIRAREREKCAHTADDTDISGMHFNIRCKEAPDGYTIIFLLERDIFIIPSTNKA